MVDLQGKRALVTGAGMGIGQGIAIGLARNGASVAVHYAHSAEGANDTLEQVRQAGADGCVIQGDLGSVPECERVVSGAIDALDGLDILVNNAGIIRRDAALEFGEDDWEGVIQINLSAAFYLSQAAARRFVEQGYGGKIINTASVLSYEGGITVPSYAASKAGIANLTRALANEWAPLGINVNALAPSYYTTELTGAIRENEERSTALLARIPAGRYGEPEDLKGAVVLLSSAAGDFIHGSVLPVDGGWLGR